MKNAELILELLSIHHDVPLSEKAMVQKLTATFYPPYQKNDRIERFTDTFKTALIDLGVQVLPYEKALDPENRTKVKSGVVIIARGNGTDNNLAIKKVSSLYHNPVVNIFDGPPPIPENPSLQETLDSIVSVLAWHLSHVPVFVEDHRWTYCTMNGAVVECGEWQHMRRDILHSLIPKLSAQVMPPKREHILYREHTFDAIEAGYDAFIDDFMNAARVWRENGLMLAHTSIEDLDYRNRFFKRIVSQYLDHRTGMSYGFMVKQLPTKTEPAIKLADIPGPLKEIDWENQTSAELDGTYFVLVNLFDEKWIIPLPGVWLLSTRSGCNKTNLNPSEDILKLGLQNGHITIDTPRKLSAEECRPSYDTYAILAHAVGNIITASLLKTLQPKSPFPRILADNGLSISHWHGYPDSEFPTDGYLLHGEENPPVSCSTPQSAAYAFKGKLKALAANRQQLDEYRGDIHVEPHHGTNITGCMTITETAQWVDAMHHSTRESAKI